MTRKQKAKKAAYYRRYRKKNLKKVRRCQRRCERKNPEKAKARIRRWHKCHPGRGALLSRRYYEKQKKKIIKRTARWRKRNPERYRAQNLKRYGITTNEFSAFQKAQDNRCRICQKIFDKTPTVDHSHKTGAIRGLLCGPCNTGLGMFKDSEQFLTSAIKYLKETER